MTDPLTLCIRIDFSDLCNACIVRTVAIGSMLNALVFVYFTNNSEILIYDCFLLKSLHINQLCSIFVN